MNYNFFFGQAEVVEEVVATAEVRSSRLFYYTILYYTTIDDSILSYFPLKLIRFLMFCA